MPRRNRNAKAPKMSPRVREELNARNQPPERPLSPEQMARRLVIAGVCSPQILDRGLRFLSGYPGDSAQGQKISPRAAINGALSDGQAP